ncbi:MAG: MurR/RpiR family transcriptional regulator [Lawsonibacter sp.]
MQESLLYIQRIRALYHTRAFSKSDLLIADYILENPTCVASSTASSLASDTGTSPATVVRFCRKLGFSGLADMKMSMMYNYVDNGNAIMDLNQDDSVGEIKHKVINFTKVVLDQLNETLSEDALAQAAKMIAGANKVVIIGEGGSGTICRVAYDVFLKLAIPCQFVSDAFFQAMVISMMEENDVLLIIANSGRPINSVQNAQQAKESGLKTIGIVGPANSPLAKYLDIEIRTSLFNSDYFSDLSAARTCELTTISILHSIIALACEDAQLERGRKIAQSMERKRFPIK